MTARPATNRRRHERANARLTAVVFDRRGAPLPCTVENLSAGGALMCAAAPLTADGPVRVRLRLATERNLTITARVVRRHPCLDGQHRFAVAFVNLPPAVEDMVQSASLRALAATRPGINILVVDDESVVRNSLARELRSLGAAAREASCAFDAVVQLQEVKPAIDAAIVDVQLDRDDGLDVLRHLAGEHPEVHRVVMSGRVGHADLLRAQASGLAHQVIVKPWQHGDLQRVLRLGQ